MNRPLPADPRFLRLRLKLGLFIGLGLVLGLSLLLGLVLFCAINLQQVGLLGTSVSNAGFITGLYVVLVPVLLRLGGTHITRQAWIAVALATAGLSTS